jgi:Tfp pilus assembly protein PilF
MTKATATFFAPRLFFIQRSAARAAATWTAIAFGCCVAILACSSSAGALSARAAAAQPPAVQAPIGPSVRPGIQTWIGRRIIPAHRDVLLHNGTAVVGPIAEVVVRVEDARDNQLLLRSLGRAGWIAVGDAVPLEEAVAYFTAKIKQNPADSDAYQRRGCAWFTLERYDPSLADYTEAIRLDPNSPALYNARAIAWCRKREYAKALEDYAAAGKLEPGNALVRYNAGNVWLRTGNYARALAGYDQAIRLDPKLGWAYDARAMLLASCQDPKLRNGREAVRSATTACELDGWKESPQLETLAAAYAESGDFASAVQWQTRAMERMPPEAKNDSESRLQLYRAGQPYRLR